MKEPNNTLQQLERNSNTPTTGSAKDAGPSIEWIAAFKSQATQDMMDDVAAYVAKLRLGSRRSSAPPRPR
jgi:hypothetical protein